jgi:hypothetical protein
VGGVVRAEVPARGGGSVVTDVDVAVGCDAPCDLVAQPATRPATARAVKQADADNAAAGGRTPDYPPIRTAAKRVAASAVAREVMPQVSASDLKVTSRHGQRFRKVLEGRGAGGGWSEMPVVGRGAEDADGHSPDPQHKKPAVWANFRMCRNECGASIRGCLAIGEGS